MPILSKGMPCTHLTIILLSYQRYMFALLRLLVVWVLLISTSKPFLKSRYITRSRSMVLMLYSAPSLLHKAFCAVSQADIYVTSFQLSQYVADYIGCFKNMFLYRKLTFFLRHIATILYINSLTSL